MSVTPTYPFDADTPTSHLPFSPCVRVGDLLFVSGQASVGPTGAIIPDTFEGEVRRSIENLRRVLEGAGCSLVQVVQTRNYVRDDDRVAEFNKLYAEYFQPPHPARTTITRCLGDDLQYEIECVAVVTGSV